MKNALNLSYSARCLKIFMQQIGIPRGEGKALIENIGFIVCDEGCRKPRRKRDRGVIGYEDAHNLIS
ncbi:MAG TPA: hypothetical protein PKY20_05240, partial [Methanothrix sp.]|nr:hypothetical protein [Methanothrix sp.]